MDANPYLPPSAVIADIPADRAVPTPAFAVSITKLAVMSLFTGGLYQLYWFYKHWVAIKRRTGESIWPVWRAIFSVIWCYSLISSIHAEARKQRVDNWISVGGLTAGWVILSLLARLPDPWWLVSLFAFLFLLPVQKQANDLNAKVAPGADPNSRFSWANIVWLVFMGLFWTLAIIGMMLPPEAAA
jgi:hypothetical protein